MRQHQTIKNNMKKQEKKDLGQYFTISDALQQFVFDKVKHKSSLMLEPSFGAGHLLEKFKEYDPNYPMVCYELDSTVKPVVSFNKYQQCIYGDFIKHTSSISQKFKTIIGNPPYVKQKTGNLYIKFIELCFDHLDGDGGEMIFIVPSDFIKLTSAARIIDKMTQHGSFTDFLFPNNEKLFEGASIDVLVFRYEKGVFNHLTTVVASSDGQGLYEKNMFCNVNKGIITFSDTEIIGGVALETLFSAYVGLVSGKDEIYRVPFGNIDVLIDEGRTEKFIFTETMPTNISKIDSHLYAHKDALLKRKIKKFSERNWFEWGAPRNILSMHTYWGQDCIYVRNMTRHNDGAFIGKVQYFGGALLCLVPNTASGASVDLQKIVDYLNSTVFQKDYIYAGRFKIGHKQLCSVILPPSIEVVVGT